ncbi:hypothetical protein BHE90_003977 [Fusarium euwallaceae]|uniref:Uncharacterized protein n=2 Tax=Fusarium solani species complex TaxID=232080 RepID=A0A430M0L5_9HYPO|nr:hypothetical protein BHE90_003977 [Fusarium euwallaceae]
MTTKTTPDYAEPIPETAVQQSILHQAQAAAANLESSTGQEAFLQDIDLVNPEDGIPPPPYGDTYGEVRNEKDAPGTSACVTDDGRVNIRINHLNRRLSQIFTPALRQEIIENDRPPPPPYIPPSLGGEDGVPPPPPLNVVIQVVGSRGDVQPFVALGQVLKNTYGHRVRLATHPTFKDFVQENGLEFFSIGGDPSRLMAFMVKNPGLMPGFRSLLGGEVGERRRDVAEYIQGCWRSCYKAGDGMDLGASDDDISEPEARPFVADCIIANPPSFAHIHCTEKLGIPLHIMFTMPCSPTQAFPHPLANIQSSNADPQLTNYISYSMIEVLSWQALGDIINRFRAKCLGLDPVSMIWGPGMLQRLKIPHTYCWSPALIPKPKDWGSHVSVSGFYLLNLASDYTPPPELQAFLDAGPPPIYIGFGSIVLDDPNAMTELIFKAVGKTGQRVLLSKGWGGMGADELHIPDGVFMLGNVPHDWLFKQVSCVVHHGGAGTTAAGITAGRPTLVIPFFGDQPFWGAMVARAGAGPDPIPHKQLTVDKLAEAINFCLKPSSLERARELASKMAAERRTDMGAQSFHQHLDVDRLRCTLVPSRPATWRIKRTQIRLSAFAACTLANANLLGFHDLKLFRPQEHYTDEGPLEPISGGTMAFAGSVGSMLMGLVDFPSETLKALNMSSGPSRKPTSPTTMESQESLGRVRGSLGSSSSASNVVSSSMSGEKDHDMLRQSAAHTSKGLGQIVKAIVQGPMDISVSFTKGLHNVPKLLGDDTVRPQEQVSDFKSGARAAGREFGLGWYDGVTGLFTQPWRGAQKEGVGGFFKGIGRGFGGFVAKPCAGVFGIPGYVMKGVHKEVQKLFGSNVQSYIVASRTAQGYEEWMQSSDAEKEDVIARWRLIQKYLKKKPDPEMVRDLLEAQGKTMTEDRETLQSRGSTTSSAQSSNSTDTLAQEVHGAMLAINSQPAWSPTSTAPVRSVEETSHGETEEDTHMERVIQETPPQLHQRRESADHHEDLHQAIAASKVEARRQAKEELEYEKQVKQAMAWSLSEQRQHIGRASGMNLDDGGGDESELARRRPEKAAASHDSGHLAGITQNEFEAQQQGEKTTQERTEEEIVMEYIKKQSVLEVHHKNRAKDEDDQELQRALELSMQGHQGGAPGT